MQIGRNHIKILPRIEYARQSAALLFTVIRVFHSPVIHLNSRTHILNDLNFSYFFSTTAFTQSTRLHFYIHFIVFPFLTFFGVYFHLRVARSQHRTDSDYELASACGWLYNLVLRFFVPPLRLGRSFVCRVAQDAGALVCAFQPKTAACRTRQLTVENSPLPTYRYLLRAVKQVEYVILVSNMLLSLPLS